MSASGPKVSTRLLDILQQDKWEKTEPAHFTGPAYQQRKNMTTQEKADIYASKNAIKFFKDITGKEERDFFQEYGQQYQEAAAQDVAPITIRELRKQYEAINQAHFASGAHTTEAKEPEVVTGLDVTTLMVSSASANSICQVASQFNGLEAVSVERMPISNYPSDRTQGPRAVMPCLHELAKREVAGFNAFSTIIPDEAERDKLVKNGYVCWGNKPEEFYEKLKNNIDNLQVLAMVGKPELSDHCVLQVYAAAAPVNAYENRGDTETQNKIARELLIAQYEALGMIAAIRAHQTGKPVNLNITLLGGGAFHNSPEDIEAAVNAMREKIKGYDVNLAIHVYNPAVLESYPSLKDLPRVSGNDFIKKMELENRPEVTQSVSMNEDKKSLPKKMLDWVKSFPSRVKKLPATLAKLFDRDSPEDQITIVKGEVKENPQKNPAHFGAVGQAYQAIERKVNPTQASPSTAPTTSSTPLPPVAVVKRNPQPPASEYVAMPPLTGKPSAAPEAGKGVVTSLFDHTRSRPARPLPANPIQRPLPLTPVSTMMQTVTQIIASEVNNHPDKKGLATLKAFSEQTLQPKLAKVTHDELVDYLKSIKQTDESTFAKVAEALKQLKNDPKARGDLKEMVGKVVAEVEKPQPASTPKKGIS